MPPLKPHWCRPSHPDVQEVIVNDAEFTSKSLSKVDLPPFAVFAKMAFPPCDVAEGATYATVQMGRDKHLNLNSDLLYINHSCEPSLIFDTGSFNVLAGPKGLKAGDELTFFYPSTEWEMAQPFDCLCGTPTCRDRISGARDMAMSQLEGVWLNGHIRELLDERDSSPSSLDVTTTSAAETKSLSSSNATTTTTTTTTTTSKSSMSSSSSPLAAWDDQEEAADPTATALKDALAHAEKVVEAARLALHSYLDVVGGAVKGSENAATAKLASVCGAKRRGPTSRELGGEMGGDTIAV